MKCIFKVADEYIRQSDWKDLALIKFCLCAMGILLGMAVAPRSKKTVGMLAMLVFVATYVPLMLKLFTVTKGHSADIEI